MNIIWKDIPNFEEKYQASTKGEIRNKKNNKIVKQYVNNKGYYTISLYINNKQSRYNVHTFIAKTFIKNSNNLPLINHIDGNKLNNNIENLEWCTSKHNIKHAYDNGLKKGYRKKVYQYDKSDKLIAIYESQTLASMITKIKQSGISRSCNSNNSTAGGFFWRWR